MVFVGAKEEKGQNTVLKSRRGIIMKIRKCLIEEHAVMILKVADLVMLCLNTFPALQD
jgi:hypothetical protein